MLVTTTVVTIPFTNDHLLICVQLRHHLNMVCDKSAVVHGALSQKKPKVVKMETLATTVRTEICILRLNLSTKSKPVQATRNFKVKD